VSCDQLLERKNDASKLRKYTGISATNEDWEYTREMDGPDRRAALNRGVPCVVFIIRSIRDLSSINVSDLISQNNTLFLSVTLQTLLLLTASPGQRRKSVSTGRSSQHCTCNNV